MDKRGTEGRDKSANLIVEYVVPHYAIEALEGVAVDVYFSDGDHAAGVLQRSKHNDKMIDIYDTIRPEVLHLRTHIENIERVIVP